MTSAVRQTTNSTPARRAAGAPYSEIRNPKSAIAAVLLALLLLPLPGCGRGPAIIPPELRKPIDRGVVEFPAGYEFERFVTNLTAPTAMAFDADRDALIVAEGGVRGAEPRILGFDLADGTTFTVYPQGKRFLGLSTNPFRMYGPVGGLAVRDGTIYVSHRDAGDFGVISALTYEGKGTTVVGGLPAQGDYGVTDLGFSPQDGRLYFGVGAATNSGVVGLDNWAVGWPRRHPKFADRPYRELRLRGTKFLSNNPRAGLFTGSELAISAAFQQFAIYYYTRIDAAPGAKPNAAIYSIDPRGGIAQDLKVEAHGIRYAGGLAFNWSGRLYASNQGMQLRGSRPVRDDPDTILHIQRGNKWLGWPDFSADLSPITNTEFQPLGIPGMADHLRKTGNTQLTFLIEHIDDYNSPEPDRGRLLRAMFLPQSGAAKMTFLPSENTPFAEFSDQLIVALSGDRAPFATMNKKLKDPYVGRKLVRLDIEDEAKVVHDFIRNTAGIPRSATSGGGPDNPDLLERPIDVKVGPDGFLYVLDLGRLEMRGGKERITARTGQIFRLRPPIPPATQPAPEPGAESQTPGPG